MTKASARDRGMDGRQPAGAGGHPADAGRGGRELLAPLLPGGEPVEQLLRTAQFFVPGTPSPDYREVHRADPRRAEEFYRERWRHDKVVRSTHGVNCTGSCSWKVYVKDGIITWETQQTDYPSTGPDSPEYEPRGCPRGASFSWYTYSPSRVRYPYVRGPLLESWREARARLGDPVAAWAEITGDPERAARYKNARGKGGFVRSTWPEVTELIAAAHVHTVKAYGPDRVVGFSPIPAMSQVSYAAGTRFLSMIGAAVSAIQITWWVGLPYLALGIFVVGHIWRWQYDQFGWTSRSTQLQERRLLKWGSPVFHYGTFAAIGGHVIGVLIPEAWTRAVGIPENVYRWFSAGAGTLAAVLVITGVVILASRPADHSAGAGHHRAGGLRCADPAADHHPDRHRPDHLRQPARPRLRLPHHCRALVPWAVQRITGRERDGVRPSDLPGPRHSRVGDLGSVAVQPARARLELPAVVPVAALRRLPPPPRGPRH